MGKREKKRLAASATPWDDVPDKELAPPQLMVVRSHRSMYEFRHERFPGDADFFNGYAQEACPRCGDPEISRRTHDAHDVRRYLCKQCGRTFTPQTGTIFEDRKLPLSAWTDYLLQVFSYDSFSSMT